MALLCKDYDLLFTHVPRTGGGFVERVLRDHLGGIPVGQQHDTFRGLNLNKPPAVRVFIVRDPLSWYRSYWAYQRNVAKRNSVWPLWDDGTERHPTVELDHTCGSPSFERFVRRALDRFPNGFARSMYCKYLNGATHVMCTSQLHTDLETLLQRIGFDHPSVVRGLPLVNEGDAGWLEKAVLSPGIEERLREVDSLEGLEFPDLAAARPAVAAQRVRRRTMIEERVSRLVEHGRAALRPR
jgi:hypothetical protein